jgi:hypothetical protein
MKSIIVVGLSVLAIGCGGLSPGHQAMVGHWQEVVTTADVNNPNYKASVGPAPMTELYIARSEAWVLEPRQTPRKVTYTLTDPGTFAMKQVVVTPKGERIESNVTISADGKEMRSMLSSQTPVGEQTITTVFHRVDDVQVPPGWMIEGKDGASSSTSTLPVWIRPYPKASTDMGSGDGMNFITSDKADQVIAFYTSALVSAGFAVDNAPAQGSLMAIGGGKSMMLKATRPLGHARLEFEMAAHEQMENRTQTVGRWTVVK